MTGSKSGVKNRGADPVAVRFLIFMLVLLTVPGCAVTSSSPSPSPIRKTMKIPMYNSSEPKAGAGFQLAQPWSTTGEAGFQHGEIHLAWSPDRLVVTARMDDRDVKTSATASGQKLWMIGDVFEVFAQVEGREDYVELHVSPNNHRMHLKLPRVSWRPSPEAEPLTFDQVQVRPEGFISETVRTPAGWSVRMEIPAPVMGLEEFRAGDRLRVSFCRYDYNGDREPVLSTTANHRKIAFHQPGDWTPVVLEAKLAGQ